MWGLTEGGGAKERPSERRREEGAQGLQLLFRTVRLRRGVERE